MVIVAQVYNIYIYMYVCMYVRMYTYNYINIYMYVEGDRGISAQVLRQFERVSQNGC
jgi:hypothetical protein